MKRITITVYETPEEREKVGGIAARVSFGKGVSDALYRQLSGPLDAVKRALAAPERIGCR